ncbi:TetR/AcrR family transcriptional regulator [Streptomyces sulfonofaciens]|uniref:TetR/AcrR family transcriptional regulator n=1 Tax=Streptomyces sulfonofaciens TaxID=68272 RepID=UPI001E489B6E|nr:TetR/AcrR family transcriptional regulator [Streptomyces sulfonofaciens]
MTDDTARGRASGRPAPRLPRSPEAQRRRQEILHTAVETFAARGYHNASLAEIADRVGLTQAGVLHYFRSKALLLTGVLELRDQTDIEQLGPERPRGLAFLRHLVDTAHRNAEREGIVRLYAVLSAESVTEGHPAQAYFRDRYTGLRTFVADALCEACGLGPAGRPGSGRAREERPEREHPQTRPAGSEPAEAGPAATGPAGSGEWEGWEAERREVEHVANAVIAVMDGLQVQWLLSPEAVDMAAATDRVVSALLASLAPERFGPGAGSGAA